MQTRHRLQPSTPRRLALLAGLSIGWIVSPTFAADPATQPSVEPIRVPALEQLNLECVSLYERLQGSVLRVQMPTPLWVANANLRDDGLFKRYNVNPDVKRALEKAQSRGGNNLNNSAPTSNSDPSSNVGNSTPPAGAPGPSNGGFGPRSAPGNGQSPAAEDNNRNFSQNSSQRGAQVEVPPNNSLNSPGTQPQADNASQQQSKGYTYVVPPQQGGINNDQIPAQLLVGNRSGTNSEKKNDQFAPNCVGLLIDDKGHVLVPMYIEREAIGEQTVKLAVGDGEPAEATFVGSDEQTQLTVLRLNPAGNHRAAGNASKALKVPAVPAGRAAGGSPATKPVRLSRAKLPEGTLVLMLSPTDGVGRLSVWNGGSRETGIIVSIDGQVSGIARAGQFLSGSACRLIADQIIGHGSVRRATLGVIVTQVEPADLTRQQAGDQPADRTVLRVDQVIKGSSAEQGGVRPGDLILSVADEAVHDIPGLAALVAERQGTTKLTVLREGKPLVLEVCLVQR